VTIAQGSKTGQHLVTALSADSGVELTATLGGTTVYSSVTISP